ncbi:11018_t:CDS:2 [Entrophospora sp. SA101]|nr:11018_t:CDS:2 [Entrophospora sp. SA101]
MVFFEHAFMEVEYSSRTCFQGNIPFENFESPKHATSSTFKYIPKHLLKNKIFSQLMTNESFQNLFSLAQSDKESNMWAQLADFGRRGLLSNSSREYLIFKNMLAGMDLRSIW